MPSIVPSAAFGALSAVYKFGHGISQIDDSVKRAARNRRPWFDIQQEYYDNQDIAEKNAARGFSAATTENYNTENERGLQASIDASLQAGGGPNSVQNAYSTYNTSNRAFAAADSEKQTANLKDLFARNIDLAGQKTQAWALNKYEKFKDEAKAIAAERTAGFQNIGTSLAEGTALASSVYTAGVNKDINQKKDRPDNSGRDVVNNNQQSSLNPFADYFDYLKGQQVNEGSDAASEEGNLTPAQIAAIRKILNGAV